MLGAVLCAQSITITSPNGGERWIKGSSHAITWNARDLPAGTFKITLWRGSTQLGVIATGLPGHRRSFDWTVGNLNGGSAAVGFDYSVKVKLQGKAVADDSDGVFRITRKSFQASPAGGGVAGLQAVPGTIPRQNIQLPPNPDLVPVSVSPVQENLKAGDQVEFSVTVQNKGTVASTRTFGTIHLQTHWAGRTGALGAGVPIPPIPPGENRRFQSEPVTLADNAGVPMGGDFTIWVKVDTEQRNNELSEENNQLKSSMSVQKRCDIFPPVVYGQNVSLPDQPIHIKNISVRKGDKVWVIANIEVPTTYFGNVFTPGKVLAKCTGFPDYIVPEQFVKRTDDGLYTRFRISFYRTWDTAGEKRVEIIADADNQIEEWKEFNNKGLLRVTVH